MRRAILVGGLVLAHLLAHVAFGYGRGIPDLMVIGLLIGGRGLRVGQGAGLGFALGLLEDSFSVLSFGSNTFSMTTVGILASRSRGLFLGDSTVFVVAYFFVGKFLRDGLTWFVSDTVSRPPLSSHLLVDMPLGALYVAVVGFVVVFALGGRLEVTE